MLQLSDSAFYDAIAGSTLEWKLTSPYGFGLTSASPLQRAICRIADGLPLRELRGDPAVRKAVGEITFTGKPTELAIMSGIRTGKSLFAAVLAVHWSQVCDVTGLGPGEIPRVSIVSLKKDLADVVFSHIVGRIQESTLLSRLLLSEPTADSISLRHPTGRPIEIRVVSGSRAGSSLTARWSAGCVFDEFPRMVGADDGVINWDHERRSVMLRIRRGCQLVHIGSPWAPFGPAYELVQACHGRPTKEMVVIKAPAYVLNPSYWDETRVAEAKSLDIKAYTTDVEAEFATQEETLFDAALVDRSTRQAPAVIQAEEGQEYRAAMDPATRTNGWTLVIATRKGPLKQVVFAKEWRGAPGEPLSPKMVLSEIAGILGAYGIRRVESDQYYIDALIDTARELGITISQSMLNEREKTERWMALRAKLAEGELEFAPEPLLVADIKRLGRRVTQSGTSIVLPKTKDGRHCDYAPSILLVLSSYLSDAHPPSASETEADRMRKEAQRRFGRKRTVGW